MATRSTRTTRTTRITSRALGLLSSTALLAGTAVAVAGEEGIATEARFGVNTGGPVIFTWERPLGRAAHDPRIIQIVRETTWRSPEEVAQRVVNQILDRGLQEGEVAILLLNFGMGHGDPSDNHTEGPALFCHWGDAVAHAARPESDPSVEVIADEDSTPKWWYTPWMSHGIATCRDYMERFIARYKLLQATDHRIPDPARFHFDSEETVSAFRTHTTHLFTTMMEDPRWDTEPIPGFGSATLADLYAQAGSPNVNPSLPYNHPVNREWATWYGVVTHSANEGAMDVTAYQLVREAWPNALSSNYGSSAAADGQGTPRRVKKGQVTMSWLELWHKRRGDLQAPVYYIIPEVNKQPGESTGDMMVRYMEERLPTMIFSHGGPRGDVTPWLLNPGQSVVTRPDLHVIHGAYARRQYEVLWSWGIDELLLWSTDSSQQTDRYWNELVEAIDAVYGPRLVNARLIVGDSDDRRLSLLRRRWNDPAVISSYGMGEHHLAAVETSWRTPWTGNGVPPRTFRITYVQTAGPEPRIRLKNHRTGRWQDAVVTEHEHGRVMLDFDRTSNLVDASGTVTAHVEWRDGRSFDAELDLLMLTAIPTFSSTPTRTSKIQFKMSRP